MSDGLLPCPFCSGTDIKLKGATGEWYYKCSGCFAMINYGYDCSDSAQRAWNKRLYQPAEQNKVGRSTRSNHQNRYYHGVVLKVFENSEVGYTAGEWHEILKHKFLKEWRTIKTKKGPEEIEITRSTTDLNTKQFEEFMTQVRQWASIELGLWVPEPNEAPMEE